MGVRTAFAILCCLLLLVGASSFVVSPSDSMPEPADFDRTVGIGLTLEQQQLLGADRVVPRVQIAYSQFPYVVGYRGLGLAAAAVGDPLVRQQFGYPRTVYVEAAPPSISLDADGYLVGTYSDEWLPADDAYFVTESDARTPAGPTPVAFATESGATAFAAEYGGTVVGWDEREQFAVSQSDGTTARDRVERQHDTADRTVENTSELRERPVETVVGADAPTVQAAIDTAEPNTAVYLPPGTYDGPVEIDKPVTLLGDNATVAGDDTGTVITVTSDDVAVIDLAVAGIGDALRSEEPSTDDGADAWDRQNEEAYGYSDAAITADSVDRLLVSGIEAETPASGIVLRDVDEAVVDGVHIVGTDEWGDGFMGVVTIRSPAVIQGSNFTNGRDGVYTHRSSGITIRENRFVNGRFGVHLMYTSDALVAENCARGQALSGIVIMTNPSGNAIVDNRLTETRQGITTSGSDSFIGGNTVTRTDQAISTSARNSLYTENTVVGNEVGFRASSIFPTSVVVRNDIVDNDRHVRATSGPLRVWSDGEDGNYWSGADGLDRPYSPTDAVDSRLHRTDAARTLAAAPVVRGLRTLRGEVPGMRGQSVIDAAPRKQPVNRTRLDAARAISTGEVPPDAGCSV